MTLEIFWQEVMIVGKDTVMVRKRYDRPVRLSLQTHPWHLVVKVPKHLSVGVRIDATINHVRHNAKANPKDWVVKQTGKGFWRSL